MNKIYLDYAATTPVKKEVLKAMLPFLGENFGNPSSIHRWGRTVRSAVDEAREKVANFFNCDSSEIIFTSGATESINLAILGLVTPIKEEKPHIITSQFEHHAVLHTCQYLEETGLAEVTYIKPQTDGIVKPEDIRKAVKENTRLVTIMYVNNEIGTIQPIREIGKMIEKLNTNRKRKIYFHTDAVQAVGYLPVNVEYLHVDMLSFTAHKIYGPKGVGGLYLKKGTPVKARLHGGGQENSFRPGTENVSGIIGLAKAVELLKPDQEAKEMAKLRDYFLDRVLTEIPDTFLNGSREQRSPNNANIFFKYVEGESIVLSLDLEGIGASTGSACTSAELKHSHVLMSCYGEDFRAAGSVRFTFGEGLSKKDVDTVVEKLKEIIKRLRAISPYGKGEK